ncbi:MAG: HlyD family secretion protein, partial [Candidatus Cyclobacteriaceae bacterium M3_2C_046]
ITTRVPPTDIVNSTSGNLKQILVKEGQMVKMGDPLAVIDNAADYEEVLQLSLVLKNINTLVQSDLSLYEFRNLGIVQPYYNNFLNAYKDYQLYHHNDYLIRHKEILNDQIAAHKDLIRQKENQYTNMGQATRLYEKDYNRSFQLYQDSVISAREFEKTNQQLLQHHKVLLDLTIEIAQEKINLHDLQKELNQLEQSNSLETSHKSQYLETSIKALQAQIDLWDKTYIISATIPGKISFAQRWSAGDHIPKDATFLSILSPDQSQLLGEARIPVENSGKVKRGQTVLIYLDNFPYAEYGYIKGTITRINQTPRNRNYTLFVQLPEGLKTNMNKELPYQSSLFATGEIIT